MRGHVRDATGWAYEVERTAAHAKPGWVSRAPGAALDLCYPIRWGAAGAAGAAGGAPRRGGPRLNIALGYLRSYDSGMGNATLECVRGCSCARVLLQGRHASRTSVTVISQVAIRPARRRLALSLPQGGARGAAARRHGRALRADSVNSTGAPATSRGEAAGERGCPCRVRLTNTVARQEGGGAGGKFKVNLMLVFEDREAYHLRKTFNSNGGYRQAYLHVGDGGGRGFSSSG